MKILKRILFFIFVIIILVIGANTVANTVNYRKMINLIDGNFSTVGNKNAIIPETDNLGWYSFTTPRNLKVIQMTDLHIGGGWASREYDIKAINAVAAMITAEKPDLVIFTGDIVFAMPFKSGTLNNLTGQKMLAALMEKLGVYYTVTFGNHDYEFYHLHSGKKLADFYESDLCPHCLFKSGDEDVDGYGNYIINIRSMSGSVKHILVFMDSHSFAKSDLLGLKGKYDCIHDSQIEWYRNIVDTVKRSNVRNSLKTPLYSTLYMHIPMTEYRDAWKKYEEKSKEAVYYYGDKNEGICCPYKEDGLFEALLENNTIGVFCGHDHVNVFSIEYKGIRLTYSPSIDYFVYGGIDSRGNQRGCTVIEIDPSGLFDCKKENYYSEKYVSVFEKEEVTLKTE